MDMSQSDRSWSKIRLLVKSLDIFLACILMSKFKMLTFHHRQNSMFLSLFIAPFWVYVLICIYGSCLCLFSYVRSLFQSVFMFLSVPKFFFLHICLCFTLYLSSICVYGSCLCLCSDICLLLSVSVFNLWLWFLSVLWLLSVSLVLSVTIVLVCVNVSIHVNWSSLGLLSCSYQ